MRSTLLALLGSMVLVASAMMLAPADVESKGKWPMTWKDDDKNWTSKPVIVGNRPGLFQHHIMAFTVNKKPGRDRCVAKFGVRQKGRLKSPLEVSSVSRKPKTVIAFIQYKFPDSQTGKGFGRFGVKTNGNCEWRLRLWGPRKGKP